jgi:hypothetical protein
MSARPVRARPLPTQGAGARREAVRRAAPKRREGYPTDQAKPPARACRAAEASAALPRCHAAGRVPRAAQVLAAPCGQSPPALSLAIK